LSNDSSSADNHHSSNQPPNDSKCSDSVDFNSNALVEPNRETAVGSDDGRPASPSSCQLSQAVATSTDTELTSVAHMLDVASAANLCTLLTASLTPPKTASAVGSLSEKTAMPDDTASVEAAESVAEAVARDVIQRNKVHKLTE